MSLPFAALFVFVVRLACLAGPALAVERRDPAAARAFAASALEALEQHRPNLAAPLFDRAHAHDPHPLWAVAGGEAWLLALEPEQAVARLEAALADDRLDTGLRERVARLLESARSMYDAVAAAKRAEAERRPEAAELWLDVFYAHDSGRALLYAGRAMEQARRFAEAHRAFSLAAERTDLAAEEHAFIDAARSRLVQRIGGAPEVVRRAPERGHVGAGLLLGVGGALALSSIGAFVVADDHRAALDAALNPSGPIVTAMTRKEALDHRGASTRWTAIGWTALAVGVVAAGVGAWLLVDDAPTTRLDLSLDAGGASLSVFGVLP